ncbi:oligogalacturonate lyase family protein [Anaerobaca lacustris]|uniref:Oligogalacturonate lyase family protein n=1 Tax=Anaerobaca lacustris TaxID=3044600 RepID=A0AAW6U9B2_9BACT|nr:oligogalacturonate lyase family protein [Sedimentisphaerales bacterium M17dextr]
MTDGFRTACVSIFLALALSTWACGDQEASEGVGVGRRFPPERTTYVDSVTGAEVTMLTTSPARDDKIYQTHPNWTADGEHIVFLSDRTGSKQYFAVSTRTGAITQLTDDSGPGNACLSRTKNRMFYSCGRAIWDLDVDAVLRQGSDVSNLSYRRRVVDLPENTQLHGTLTVDSDGRTMYLSVQRGDTWALLALDTEQGHFRTIREVEFRVGHCQAHPTISGLIMYCWETGGDSPQRMWIVRADGSDNGPFYEETYDEWVTHEVWWGADKALFTIWPKNEEMLGKPHGIAWVALGDRSLHILDQKKYWHVGGDAAGEWAVGDTFGGQLFLVHAPTGQARLLTQGHRPKGATVHPHPCFSPDGSSVLFCSERNGNWDVCLVRVKN